MSTNNAIAANAIAIANTSVVGDYILMVRNPTTNSWTLELVNTAVYINSAALGLTANVVVGANTLHFVNGLLQTIT